MSQFQEDKKKKKSDLSFEPNIICRESSSKHSGSTTDIEKQYPLTKNCSVLPTELFIKKEDSNLKKLIDECCSCNSFCCGKEEPSHTSKYQIKPAPTKKKATKAKPDKPVTALDTIKGALRRKYKPVQGIKVTSGFLSRPRRIHGPNTSLASIRLDSMTVLEKKLFKKHTNMDSEGALIQCTDDDLRSSTIVSLDEDEETPEEVLTNVNYVLQIRLDEDILQTPSPVDGYNEALLRSVHSPNSPENNETQRRSSRKTSISSVPLKMTNLDQVRQSSVSGRFGGTKGMSSMSMNLFLALLPSFSETIKIELLGQFGINLVRAKHLENALAKIGKEKASSERWLAVIYFDCQRITELDTFRRLLIRNILHTYLVAFEERDISRENFMKEFLTRSKGKFEIELPFVYTNGVPIGGCSMLYTLHTQHAMHKVFKDSVMDPTKYNQWLQKPIRADTKDNPQLKVPLATYHNVLNVMKGTDMKRSLEPMSLKLEKLLMEGAFVINRAQKLWRDYNLQNRYSEPDFLLYCQLQRTIHNVLRLLELSLIKRHLWTSRDTGDHIIFCCLKKSGSSV